MYSVKDWFFLLCTPSIILYGYFTGFYSDKFQRLLTLIQKTRHFYVTLDVIRTDVQSAAVFSRIRQFKTGSPPCRLEFNSGRFLVDEMALGFSFLMIIPQFLHSHLFPLSEVHDGPDQASLLSHPRSGCTLLTIYWNESKYKLHLGRMEEPETPHTMFLNT
jgi:hypothetical protein